MPRPFDLQKALAGKPVLWPGYEVRKVLYVPERGNRPRVLVITSDGLFAWFKDDGTCYGCDSLTMADPPKRRVEGWLNVYKRKGRYQFSPDSYQSSEYAKAIAANEGDPDCVGQAHVTFEVEDEA